MQRKSVSGSSSRERIVLVPVFLARSLATFLLASLCGLAAGQVIDVQTPGAYIQLVAGISQANIYRDILLAPDPAISVGAAIAQRGISASFWTSKSPHSNQTFEFLLNYSHKLPLVDVHIGYAITDLPPAQPAIQHAVRLALTNNLSQKAMIDLTVDKGVAGGDYALSSAFSYRFGSYRNVDFAGRASISRWHLEHGDRNTHGFQILARRFLKNGQELHIGIVTGRSRSARRPAENHHGVQINFVQRIGGNND
jgi:hypothetical protein